jgi:hypothetical protein
VLPLEHGDIYQFLDASGSNERRTADTQMKMATGGPLGSTAQNLWVISASATDKATGLPIPFPQISIAGLGNLDTNGNLYVMLADNQTNKFTPEVAGNTNYTFTTPVATEYVLTHQTKYPALTDTNLSRLNLGVGEYVTFGGMPADTQWTASGGGVSTNIGSGPLFTAPSNAPPGGLSVTVTATCHGKSPPPTTFTVFPPNNYDAAHTYIYATKSAGYGYATNQVAAGMLVKVCIAPTSVSFYRVQIKEIAGPGTNGWGYFAQTSWNSPPIPDHDPNPNFQLLDSNNYWGGLAVYDDCHYVIYIPGVIPPAGGFTLDIPVAWQINPNATNGVWNWSQVISFDASGTVTITKYKQEVTRTTNNVWTPSL